MAANEETPLDGGSTQRILRKTTIFEAIEKPFTTSPKTKRRRNKTNICRERAEAIVNSFYPETEVSYTAIKMKMIVMGLCADKTILSYLGRLPTKTKRTMRQTVVYEKNSTVVPKRHTFEIELPEIKGYLEIFGLATPIKKNGQPWFRLHHTFQMNLETCSDGFLGSESERVNGFKQVFSFSSNSLPEGGDKSGKDDSSEVEKRESLEGKEKKDVWKTCSYPNISRKVCDRAAKPIVIRASDSMKSLEKGVCEE